MKKLLLPFLMATLAISSCTTDFYEKGEGDFSLVQAEFANAHVNAQQQIDYVETDNDEQLNITEPVTRDWAKKSDKFYRCMFYYKKNGASVEVVSIGQVSEIGITPADTLKKRNIEVKTDPLILESIWVSKNKRYLNASIYLKTGSTSDPDAIHKMGLVGDAIRKNADNTKTFCLRLRHDQGGMPEHYSVNTFFSLPLKGVSAVVDSIQLTINTYDGVVTKTFAVK